MTEPSAGGGAAALDPQAVEALWQRFQPLVADRIATIQAHLDGEGDREDARRAAHALTGALGSYGRAGGSRVARELEELLAAAAPGRPLDPRARDLITRLRASL